MSNSPPAAKSAGRKSSSMGAAASSSSSSSKRGGGRSKSSTPGKRGKNGKKSSAAPVIDLTAFGFSRKKRPAPVETPSSNNNNAAAAGGSNDVVVLDGNSSDDVEVVISPTKRSKIGSGKENPFFSAKKPSSATKTPPKKGGKSNVASSSKRKPSTANSNQSQSSGGSRVALLDLTQDSSSDSLDKKQPAKRTTSSAASTVVAGNITSAKKPAAANASAGTGNAAKTSSGAPKQAKAAATLSGMAGALAGKMLASSTTHQQAQVQRRGKRDKQGKSKPQGVKRSGSAEAPIAIYEDERPAAVEGESSNKKAKSTPEQPPAGKPSSLDGNEPKFAVGNVVMVQDRTWPGRNDQGGVAKITKVHPMSVNGKDCNTYDLKYIVDTRKERGVEEHFIALHHEYESPEKAKNARRGFATKRPSPPNNGGNGERGRSTSPVARGRSKSPTKVRDVSRTRSPTRARSSPPGGGKKKSTRSPQQGQKKGGQLSRGNSIQSYFSAASPSSGSPKSSPKEKAGATAKSPAKSPGRSPNRPKLRVNALGLVRVVNPHQITCTTAVAKAKSNPFDPNKTHKPMAGGNAQPMRIFPGAVLGRKSNSKKMPNFVDIGITSGLAGISRKHIKVLNVSGLVEAANSPHGQEESQQLSQTSSFSNSSHPSMTIQVLENANGVEYHRTRRGKRSDQYLSKGQQITLRIGDAIALFSTNKMYYCVVGLVYPDGDGEGGALDGVAAGVEGEWNPAKGRDAARALEFTPPSGKKQAAPVKRKEGQTKSSERTVSVDVGAKKDGQMETIEIEGDDDDEMPLSALADERKMPAKSDGGRPESRANVVSSQETSAAKEGPDESMMDVTMEVESPERTQRLEVMDLGARHENKSPAAAAKSNEVTAAAKPEEPAAMVKKEAGSTKDYDALIKKGDDVKVAFKEKNMFGEYHLEGFLGTVISVKPDPDSSSCNITIKFDDPDQTIESYPYPHEDVEKLGKSKDSPDFYPDRFVVGDLVDSQWRDKGKWYRGRVASVNMDGGACDVIYNDKTHESNIPTKDKKVRRIERGDSNTDWLVGKSALMSAIRIDVDQSSFQKGEVSKEPGGNKFLIKLPNGSSESVSYEDAAKAVLAYKRKGLPINKQDLWPGSQTTSMVDTVRQRRQRKELNKFANEHTDEYGRPIPTPEAEVKPEPKQQAAKANGRKKSARSVAPKTAVKAEPVDELDEIDTSWVTDDDDDLALLPVQGGPAVDPSVLEARKVAKDFPPGLPNMLWCALNSPEAQTGSNFLRDLLCVHDSVPPLTMVQKLMDLMKYGPKAEGSSVYFKDPMRTDLAAQYVYGLLLTSKRLVRKDSVALFGPSSWDDVDVLMAQSIAETENIISGRRLAQGLQLAARGAKLLSMMFLTELQGHDLYTASSTILDSTALQEMPTVRLVKTYGVRSGLKAAVEHMTKCLVRHSRFVMDSGGIELSANPSPSDESCALEAKVCLDYLGSAVCAISWLFCVEERVEINDPSVSFVVKDTFLVEMERALEDLPEMNQRNKKKLVKKLKLYFVLSLTEEFAQPMVVTLGKMIGIEDDLAMVGLVA